MADKKTRVDPDAVKAAMVEAQQEAEVAATISRTDPERTTKLNEAIVQRREMEARLTTVSKYGCSECLAEFVLKEAAELHVESFHPGGDGKTRSLKASERDEIAVS